MKIRSLAIAVLLLSSAIVFAGELSQQKSEKARWEGELKKLKSENPTEYTKTQTTFTFVAEVLLAELGYGIGPFDGVLDKKMEAALRAYQENRKLPVTGDPLSFETVEQMKKDRDSHNYQPVGLPFLHVFIDLWDAGYVSASGTWIISGEQMGLPEQTSKIDCRRERGICTEATAIVFGEGGERQLSVDIDIYEIERWDTHEVVTKPLQFGCTRYVRRFNRVQKSVTSIRSTISTEDTCKGIDHTEKYLVLSDGFNVYWELQQKQQKKWRELIQISPELVKLLTAPSNLKQ